MNVAFIIDGSDSITGRPNGGQWKQVKQWVWNVISALDLESRPAVSYVSVMQVRNFVFQLKNCQTSSHKVQYAYRTELLGQKWWPVGCDPYKVTTEDFHQELISKGEDKNDFVNYLTRLDTNEHNNQHVQSNARNDGFF